jgi:hypothetical protein
MSNRIATLIASALLFTACGAPPPLEVGVATSAVNAIDLCPSAVPPQLAPPAGQELKAAYEASGSQIYICTANGWTFKAPQANLLSVDGQIVGTHFAGPTWKFHDGSSVVGMKLAGASVDATAIPWLLLKAISTTDSPDGDGRFADITYVQRLSTGGGLAPTSGCDASTVGQQIGVPYTADYFFYHAGSNASRRCN